MTMNKVTIQKLIDAVVAFREERGWTGTANPKNIAIATSIEAAELLEHFKWKTDREIEEYITKHKKEIEEEVADVLFNTLLMVDKLGIDMDTVFFEKMKKNNKKYPVEKVKGKNPHL